MELKRKRQELLDRMEERHKKMTVITFLIVCALGLLELFQAALWIILFTGGIALVCIVCQEISWILVLRVRKMVARESGQDWKALGFFHHENDE